MQRTVDGSLAIGMTIESAIRHLLADDKIYNRMQGSLVSFEVAGVVQDHAVDTHVALPDLCGRIDATIFAFLIVQNDGNRFGHLGMIGGDVEMLQIQQRVVRRNPLDLVETASPVTVRFASFQKSLAPAFGSDTFL